MSSIINYELLIITVIMQMTDLFNPSPTPTPHPNASPNLNPNCNTNTLQ